MKTIIRFALKNIGLCVLLGMSMSVAASAIDQLRGFLAHTQTAAGQFSQRVHSANQAGSQQSSGNFLFLRPGRFRWQYAQPYEQLIVSDGTKLFLYDKDLNQVTIKQLTGSLPASPAAILFGSNQFEQDFDVKDIGPRDGLEWINAKPKSQDTLFERIEIGFKDRLPVAMLLQDTFGQTTELLFSGIERNPSVSRKLFQFELPEGADVLEE